MKKLIITVFVLVCVLGFVGCNRNDGLQEQDKTEEIGIVNQDIPEPEAYAFEAQYIRTDGYSEGRSYPYHVVINSKEELQAYYEENKVFFDLERKEKVYSDNTIGFWDACDKYDDTYFERQNLVLIVLEESSGSIRHEITDVRNRWDEKGASLGWDITINRNVPEEGTDDMAEWHLFLEIQMGDVIKSEDKVWINGKLSTAVTVEAEKSAQSEESYFIPDYHSTNRLHSDEFLEILKRDGYYRDGEMDHSYNTDNITDIVNITPKSISNEMPDVEIFYLNTYHCFLMVNHTIYRYDTFGGYHQQLCLWDYDGNGTKDLVSYYTFGSGLSYLSVGILDLTSMENIEVITRMILSEPAFSFECKNGVIYIDGAELTYSDGKFHCDTFTTESSNDVHEHVPYEAKINLGNMI